MAAIFTQLPFNNKNWLIGLFDFLKSEKSDKKQEPLLQDKSRLLVLETILHAVDKYHDGEYSKAILFFDEVLSIDPNNNEYVLFYYRGCSNYYLNNDREALNDIEKATGQRPAFNPYNKVNWDSKLNSL